MSKFIITFLLSILKLATYSQNEMQTVDQLINKTEPGWPLVQNWISKAKNKVEVLPACPSKAKDALYTTQVTTRSPMGAIVYSSGGLLVDGGWIRILGSGHQSLYSYCNPKYNAEKFWQAKNVLQIAELLEREFTFTYIK